MTWGYVNVPKVYSFFVTPRSREARRVDERSLSARRTTGQMIPNFALPFASNTPYQQLRAYSTKGPPSSNKPLTKNAGHSTPTLTHVDMTTGQANMVDVSDKIDTQRSATAFASVYLGETTFELVQRVSETGPPRDLSEAEVKMTRKGDVLTVRREGMWRLCLLSMSEGYLPSTRSRRSQNSQESWPPNKRPHSFHSATHSNSPTSTFTSR